MKLDRQMGGAFAALAVTFACFVTGCSSVPSAPIKTAAAAPVPTDVGTTNLMFAELQGPAPKVGKAHLAVDDESLDMNEPKDARRSDGSHRGGSFGTTK